MGALSTIQLTKGNTAVDSLPKQVGNSSSDNQYRHAPLIVVFVDEARFDAKPNLDYYRKLYKDAGYSPEMVQSLVEGLAHSSLYEGKTS